MNFNLLHPRSDFKLILQFHVCYRLNDLHGSWSQKVDSVTSFSSWSQCSWLSVVVMTMYFAYLYYYNLIYMAFAMMQRCFDYSSSGWRCPYFQVLDSLQWCWFDHQLPLALDLGSWLPSPWFGHCLCSFRSAVMCCQLEYSALTRVGRKLLVNHLCQCCLVELLVCSFAAGECCDHQDFYRLDFCLHPSRGFHAALDFYIHWHSSAGSCLGIVDTFQVSNLARGPYSGGH